MARPSRAPPTGCQVVGAPTWVARNHVANGGLAPASAPPNNHADVMWAIADPLRSDCRQSEYGSVILALAVFRRLDNVLEPAKAS